MKASKLTTPANEPLEAGPPAARLKVSLPSPPSMVRLGESPKSRCSHRRCPRDRAGDAKDRVVALRRRQRSEKSRLRLVIAETARDGYRYRRSPRCQPRSPPNQYRRRDSRCRHRQRYCRTRHRRSRCRHCHRPAARRFPGHPTEHHCQFRRRHGRYPQARDGVVAAKTQDGVVAGAPAVRLSLPVVPVGMAPPPREDRIQL